MTTIKPPPPPACPTPATNSTPGPDSQNPISSWGVDGTAYTAAVIGSVVYVGGSFTHAVSPTGAVGSVRTNLAAFCIATGALLNNFVANFDGAVWALTTDGTNLFVGGQFATLNGQSVNRLVKLNRATGARLTFNAPAIPVGKPVYALDYFGGKVYVGGDFSAGSNPIVGKKGMSVLATTGAFAGWNPNADGRIQTLKVSPNGQSVFIGGTFEKVGGAAHHDLAKTAASTGAVSSVVYGDNLNVPGHVFSIAVESDSTTVDVSTGPSRPTGTGGGNKLYRFSDAGSESWHQTFNGDDQAVVLVGSTLYTGFHGGFGCNVPGAPGCNLRVLGFSTAGSQITSFNPASGGVLGVRGLAAGGNRLIAVGDFRSMGSTNKLHGLAIFN